MGYFCRAGLGRKITEEFILPKIPKRSKLSKLQPITLHSFDFDLCSEQSFSSRESIFKQCSLLIFQNCLNELYKKSSVQENMEYLLNTVTPGSLIVIADLNNYQQSHKILHQIKDSIENRNDFKIHYQEKGESNCREWLLIPGILKKNLLTKEHLDLDSLNKPFQLNPRYTVNYTFLAARKLR